MKGFRFFLFSFLFGLSLSVSATEDKFYFEAPEQQALFFELTKELRCPKCQNQNIADSDAMIAIDLKRKVYQLLQQGQTKEEVIDFMKQRYGDFVYYQPPVNSMTIWLWLLPLFFICIAIAGIVLGRKRQVSHLDDEKLKKAKALLESDE
ncbi:MAG: cytochrome c-type biogenesis protein [Paraglaciecola sp.]|uniref:cytochrome c-type biogenesis protein n=1 Tax=Paraglaciecola sp. TaxID=1920173 RepID=UPI003296A09A